MIALMDKPAVPVGRPLSWAQRIRTELTCLAALGLNAAAIVGLRSCIGYLNISSRHAVGILSCGVVAVTAVLYAYNVYLVDLFAGKSASKSK